MSCNWGKARVRAAMCAGLTMAIATAVTPVSAVASPESELAAARAQLEQIGTEYHELQGELERKSAELQDTVVKVEQTSQDLRDAQASLSEIVADGYKGGGVDLISAVFGATDLQDLISRVYYLGKIADARSEAIEEVRDLKSTLEGQQAEQQAAMDVAEARLNELGENQAAASELVNSLDAEVRAQLEAEAAQNESVRAGIQSAQDAEQTASVSEAPADTDDSASGDAEQAGQDDAAGGATEGQTDDAGDAGTQAPADEPAYDAPAADDSSSDQDDAADEGSADSSSVGSSAVSIALQYEGTPYVYGGASPSGFDCSGLVMYCYAQLGYSLPHSASGQMAYVQRNGHFTTDPSQFQYGDLVFFPGHVAFYVGNGQVFGARREGVPASTTSMYYFGAILGGGNL